MTVFKPAEARNEAARGAIGLRTSVFAPAAASGRALWLKLADFKPAEARDETARVPFGLRTSVFVPAAASGEALWLKLTVLGLY